MVRTAFNQPLVSVIIPAHNGEQFIAQAVESVLSQTYRPVEIIVINDGSTDRTAMVLQPYLHAIHYVEQQNGGVAMARNRGLAIAQGEFIAFLDQDDWLLADKLAVQTACMTVDKKLGIIHSSWHIADEQGQIRGTIAPWQTMPTLDLTNWVQWKPVFLGAMLFRRSWLMRSGGFDSRWQQTSDVDFVLRLAHLGCQASWVQQATVCYRQHKHNASRQALQQAIELQQVLKAFFERSDLPDSIKQLEARSCYQSLVWSAWRLYHNGYFNEAIEYLEKSLPFAEKSRSELLIDWLEAFRHYEAEYGRTFNIHSLNVSKLWHILVEQ
jgi:glycosyltransferase involved in cell wall biosynthesis